MFKMLELRRVRQERGISLVKLCQSTGIDPGSLSLIERGRLFPYPGWRRRIAKALELPEDALFKEVEKL